MTKLVGINLGGWLVIEKWITPSLFTGTSAEDEAELSQTKLGQQRINRHHRTFINEADFKWIVDHGFNAVRLPIGYWAFNQHAPLVGHIDQIDWCARNCERFGLKLIIDLHTLPGSQNGKAHSGQIGPIKWLRAVNRLQTIEILTAITKRFRNYNCLYGIEVANEPKLTGPVSLIKMLLFYRSIAKNVHPLLKQNQKLIFSDSFEPKIISGRLPKDSIMDSHLYQCFSPRYQHFNSLDHINEAYHRQAAIAKWNKHQPVIIGEWSLVLPAATLERLSMIDYRQTLKRYFQAQLTAMSGALGHFYWTYKTENMSDWNLKYLIDQKIVETKH